MNQAELTLGVAIGERAEPVPRRVRDPAPCPVHGCPSIGVEPLDLVTADRRGVVVAAHANRTDAGKALDDAIGFGAIADDIPEMPHGIDRTEGFDHRVEGREVGMDVRKDRDAHAISLAAAPAR